MPISRAKSCHNCRVAKSRCSLTSPCSRCSERQLECHYAAGHPIRPERHGSGRFRPIQSAADLPTASSDDGDRNGSITHYAVAAVGSIGVTPDDRPLDEMCTVSDDPAAAPNMTMSSVFSPQLSQMPTMDWALSDAWMQQNPGSFDLSAYSGFVDPLLPHFTFDSPMSNPGPKTHPPRLPGSESHAQGPQTATGRVSAVDAAQSRSQPLSERVRTVAQGSLTAKVIIGQMMDYPRMMAAGKRLPPFIHPPCAVGPVQNCPPGTPHRCLPEILAVCTSLIQMYYCRTPGSTCFVWEQIYAHVNRLHAECESYNAQRLLQALQAAALYCLLQSQDIESRARNDAAWLVSTTEKLARRIYSRCTYGLDADRLCSQRSNWVLVESLRRIGCFLYVSDLVLQIDGKTPSTVQCSESIELPLPCNRRLWEPVSDREWEERYQADIAAKQQRRRRGLTLGHLVVLRRSLMRDGELDNSSESDFSTALTEWCEEVDDFAMLIWMAFMLERDERPLPGDMAHFRSKDQLVPW